jgi:hypothetical protein
VERVYAFAGHPGRRSRDARPSAVVAWSGSTPAIVVTPDVVVQPPTDFGGDGGDGFEDFSTVETRNLTLVPGQAVVRWSGSRAYVRVELDPLRFRLPRRRVEAAPVPVAPERVVDRVLSPRAGSVAYAGSRPRVVAESFVPLAEL